MDIEVTDANQNAVLRSLIGLKITEIYRELNALEDWSQGDNSVTIGLEDGTTIRFMGWGYDASGLWMTITRDD